VWFLYSTISYSLDFSLFQLICRLFLDNYKLICRMHLRDKCTFYAQFFKGYRTPLSEFSYLFPICHNSVFAILTHFNFSIHFVVFGSCLEIYSHMHMGQMLIILKVFLTGYQTICLEFHIALLRQCSDKNADNRK